MGEPMIRCTPENRFYSIYLLIAIYVWAGFRTACELQYGYLGRSAQATVTQVQHYRSCDRSKTPMVSVEYQFIDLDGLPHSATASFTRNSSRPFYVGESVSAQYIPGTSLCRLSFDTFGLWVLLFVAMSCMGIFSLFCWVLLDALLGGRPPSLHLPA